MLGTGKPIIQRQIIGRQLRAKKEKINKLNPNISKKDAIGIIDENGNVTFFD